jgi:hypothetical protein
LTFNSCMKSFVAELKAIYYHLILYLDLNA